MSKTSLFRVLILFIMLVLIGSSCDTGRSPVYIFLKDLKGMWKLEDKEIYEKWMELKDDEYYATIYKIDGTRTTVLQNIRIIDENEIIYYEARVFAQNQGRPSRFKLVEQSKVKVIFSNEENDFPQDVQYEFLTQDSLKVTLGGYFQDSYKKMSFKYARVPPPSEKK